jgi:transposase InsO family protein
MDVRLLAAVSGELAELNIAALCREHGISRKTFYKWRARYAGEGVAGLEARSRRPLSSPTRTPVHVEDAIVEARKWLLDYGLDAGPASVTWRLRGQVSPVPSEATIWRVLTRRGFVTPQPRKRPRRSWQRFEASAPNECWQIDATHWTLTRHRNVEIIDIIDDHSRLAVASVAVASTTTEQAWAAFSAGVARWGLPTRCLSDNGLAFSGRLRGIEVHFEAQLRAVGIQARTSRPFHPQTCGKIERFHQTLKRWLAARPAAPTLVVLQAQLDEFCGYYNRQRPHRAIGRITPYQRWAATTPATPGDPLPAPEQILRRKRANVIVNTHGTAKAGRWLIGLGAEYSGQRVEVIIDGLEANVFAGDELIRHLRLDPERTYQPTGRRRGPKRSDGS